MQNLVVAVAISRFWANVDLTVGAMKLGTTPVNRGEVLEGLEKSGSFGLLPDVIDSGERDCVQRRPPMTPQTQCCHNPHCPARGQLGRGDIHVHSRAEQRIPAAKSP